MNSQFLVQLILTSVIAGVMVYVAIRWRRGEITAFQLAVWEVFWGAGILFVLFPDSATTIANRVGVGRGADLILYVSIVTLFYGLFRLIVKIERLNRDLTELVRQKALEDHRRERNRSS